MIDDDHQKRHRGAILVRIDPDLEELIPGYLQNREKDIQSMTEALGKNDCETIRILGHSMKGSGGGYGFDDITEIGRLLEGAAKEGNIERIRAIIEELAAYLKQIKIVYE
jgi:HPt (histidine-containing phosphotransfer) domain-containing protein